MKKNILELINLYFERKNNQFSILEIIEVETLLNKEIVLRTDNPNFIKLNPNSFDLNRIVINQIESETGKNTSIDIIESFKLIDSFLESKKQKYGYTNILNAYSEIEVGIKIYLIVSFYSNGTDIIAYYDSLKRKERLKIHTEIFKALVILDIPFEVLLNFLLKHVEKYSYEISSFCTNLCNKNPQKARAFFDYVNVLKYNKKYFYILSRISIELYPNDNELYYQNTIKLLSKDSALGYFILGRFQYTSIDHIVDCFRLSEKVNIQKEIDGLLQIPYLYKSLIENEFTPNDIKELCFKKFEELFLRGNDDLKNEIFQISSGIKGYEERRYSLLFKTYLSSSENYFNRISQYFREFENPQYFFHLLGNLCLISARNNKRFDISIFEEAFKRFWRKYKIETSEELLRLLTYDNPSLRLPAVDLIRSLQKSEIATINLAIINNETSQLRALEALIYSSYYNIEKLLDLILSLSKSSYTSVIEYLQKKLAELIYYSYNDLLYDLIKDRINDKNFLKPLNEALLNYHNMCDKKNEINDLNPLENEKEYMNLYYRLEKEQMQKMMSNSHKGTFLEIVKNSIIVRGNSWKIGDNEISALGKFESSMSIDKSMYKNPDLSDYKKNNFISEF